MFSLGENFSGCDASSGFFLILVHFYPVHPRSLCYCPLADDECDRVIQTISILILSPTDL